jgi:hypothetical protein
MNMNAVTAVSMQVKSNTAVNLAGAKAAVSSEIKRLEKTHKNTHGGYQFTSVDDFKDSVRPIMAKHGISLHVSEDTFALSTIKTGKEGKETNLAIIRFKFVLEHSSGEQSEPSFFTVALPYTGAQTSGAAQSYAIKEGVYKGLFQASSGDIAEEADFQEQSQLVATERLSKAEAKPLYEGLQREMRAEVQDSRDHNKLYEWWSANRDQIKILPLDWEAMLKKEYADEYKALKANEELDRGNK